MDCSRGEELPDTRGDHGWYGDTAEGMQATEGLLAIFIPKAIKPFLVYEQMEMR